jgi:hypothetical protein
VAVAIFLIILLIIVGGESGCILILILGPLRIVASRGLTVRLVVLIDVLGEVEQSMQAIEPQLKLGRVWACDFEYLFVAKDEGENGKSAA